MGPGTTRAPAATVAELALFALAVVIPPFVLGLMITAIFVAGRSFLTFLVPLLATPAVLMVLILSVTGSLLLVLTVQGRWTRPEIAVGCTATFAASLWLVPVMLISDLGAGFVLGFVLVVLGCAFGPLPVCAWMAWRMTRSTRLDNPDPDAPSWLRDAGDWVLARVAPVRARIERPDDDRVILEASRRKEAA
ncbi:hypothetical protein [Mumia flava]|uniref:hypothetical protein n=1 Tax=Mumia flava TaxID=1348852 RepID=UPI0012FD0B3E|nr:hypothetical protein [Mumia flava]